VVAGGEERREGEFHLVRFRLLQKALPLDLRLLLGDHVLALLDRNTGVGLNVVRLGELDGAELVLSILDRLSTMILQAWSLCPFESRLLAYCLEGLGGY